MLRIFHTAGHDDFGAFPRPFRGWFRRFFGGRRRLEIGIHDDPLDEFHLPCGRNRVICVPKLLVMGKRMQPLDMVL